METKYREQTYYAGNYATVSVFPVFRGGRRRCRRFKPTSEVQQRLNEQNAKERVVRLMNANFDESGAHIVLTYDWKNLPETREGMIRDFSNFVRRLKRYLAKQGVELKYIAAPHGEPGCLDEDARLNVHAVINVQPSMEALLRIWGRGIVYMSPLYMTRETGLRGLGRYFVKHMTWGRVMHSVGLVDPVPVEHTGRVSITETNRLGEIVNRIGASWNDAKAYEDLYPGYRVSSVRPIFNWFNKYYYLKIYLYKE